MSSDSHHDHDDHIHPAPTTFLTRYVFSTDHKVIGVQFLFISILFVILGGLLALGVRYQLAWPTQHVPFHAITPGNQSTAQHTVNMTSQAMESNLARWRIGGEVTFNAPTEIDGQTIPVGAKAELLSLDNGLAVYLPAGVEVQGDPGSPAIVLEQPIKAHIDPKWVLGDYNYKGKKIKLPDSPAPAILQTVRVNAPVEVTEELADGSTRTITIVKSRVYRPNPTGVATQYEDQTSGILLPIRRDASMLSLRVPAQTVEQNGEQVAVAAAELSAVPAASVDYAIQTLTSDAYLSLFTMHATIMVFFVLMPVLLGAFGNFLIPLMIGARDMAFPKLNMLSYWLAVPSGLLMLASFWVPKGASGGGWTMYPPHSTGPWGQGMGANLWVISVGLAGFSTIVGTLNYLTTIINMRAVGMGMFRMPLTIWALFITSILALFATPVVTAAAILLLFDRMLGTMFFTPAVVETINNVDQMTPAGGQPLLWQHLFWFFGHPEVYILILPPMGIASDILAVHSRKPIFGYKPMVFAMAAISGLGFIVWGHHMFQSGMNPTLGTTFMAATIMIAVPSAIKTFNWLGTLWGGDIRFTPPMLFAIGFVSMFVIGGLSGIFMASAPADIPLHDTYFIVAHIHYVFFGGTILGVFAGVYQWFPKMFGRQLNQKWGVVHFILTIIALNGTFFLMHIVGIGGHPRRYPTIMEYSSLQHLQGMNVLMTIFAMMLGMAQIPFFFNLFASLPPRLSRNVLAVFAVMLALPTVIGMTFWGGFTDGLLGQLLGHHLPGVEGNEDALFMFSGAQRMAGYALFLGVIALLLVLMLKQLPRGGKIGGGAVLGLLGATALWLIFKQVGGAISAEDYRDLTLIAMSHNLVVSIGLSMLYVAAAVAVVYIVWWIGSAVRLSVILDRALWLGTLPLFMLPMIIKKETFMWIHHPEWHPETWLGVLMISAIFVLPGLMYLLIARPKAEFDADPGRNPWLANSLEWTVDSPPPYYNFKTIPTVRRGPYEYSSPVVEKDYLPQPEQLPPGVVEPTGH